MKSELRVRQDELQRVSAEAARHRAQLQAQQRQLALKDAEVAKARRDGTPPSKGRARVPFISLFPTQIISALADIDRHGLQGLL